MIPVMLFVLGCAPIERKEARTVGDVRSRPVRECQEIPLLRVTRARGGIVVRAAKRVICRSSTREEWDVKTEYKTRPENTIFVLEIATALVGTALVVNAQACDEEGDFGCYVEGYAGFLGLVVGVPAAIGAVVDATYYRSGTETSTEHRESDVRSEDSGPRPMSGMLVTPLPPERADEKEVIEGVLGIGSFTQKVRLR